MRNFNRKGNVLLPVIVVVAILGFVVVKFCTYTVNEWEQVVITQFGQVQGDPITETGLRFKLPWQKVNRFDRRLLRWDGSQTTTITRDRRTINIDVTARWRITNAKLFLETIRSTNRAASRLNGIIEGAIKDEIAKFDLFEVVRSSNRILDLKDESVGIAITDENGQIIDSGELAALGSDLPRLDTNDSGDLLAGRPIVLDNILKEARRRIEQIGLGIDLEDVLIKELGYIREIESNVYAQMNAELQKIAAGFRSNGQQRAEERLGEMQRELAIVESSAVERSQVIRGEAEAQAIEIYAKAYNQDPEFYDFVRTLEAYEKVIESNGSLILSTDSELYKLLKRIP